MSQWKSQTERTKFDWEDQAQWKEQGVWVWVKWKQNSPKDAWKSWQGKNREIKSGWKTTGEWDCCLWVAAKSPEEAERYLQNLKKNQWVDEIESTWAYQWE
jgi:hypothetical protein